MRTNTLQTIYLFIKKHPGATAKEIVDHVRRYPTGVFRHLHRLQQKKAVYKIGAPPMVRYYPFADTMKHQPKTITNALNWAISGNPRFASEALLCPTRDGLQARTDSLITELQKTIRNKNLIYLIVAVAGEIGNNSFDHNLGRWHDVPGVYFRVDTKTREIVLADRGQGIFATIKRVRPEIRNETEAMRIAFTEMISGRAPEKRGNGLKFVKKVVETNHLYLAVYTGSVKSEITASGMMIEQSNITIPGTLAYLQF